jgi:hypothetical protein
VGRNDKHGFREFHSAGSRRDTGDSGGSAPEGFGLTFRYTAPPERCAQGCRRHKASNETCARHGFAWQAETRNESVDDVHPRDAKEETEVSRAGRPLVDV